jgi:pimeloyl-ACP methyl ester carboxylesterase
MSGHDVAPADGDARALALCIISPDRPGVGRTDRLPGYTTLSWAQTDLVPLLDHLDVERFELMGWSEGGQYALAAAVALGQRAGRCAVVAGCVPLDDTSTLRGTNLLDRSLIALSRGWPPAARACFTMMHVVSRHAPSLVLRGAAHGLPREEAKALKELGRWFPVVLGEGTSDSRGGVDEYLAISAPWGFLPEEVPVPVRIFQGSADVLVPESWGHELARRIPGAEITVFPNEGHFIAVTRRREVLEYLIGEYP